VGVTAVVPLVVAAAAADVMDLVVKDLVSLVILLLDADADADGERQCFLVFQKRLYSIVGVEIVFVDDAVDQKRSLLRPKYEEDKEGFLLLESFRYCCCYCCCYCSYRYCCLGLDIESLLACRCLHNLMDNLQNLTNSLQNRVQTGDAT